MAAYRRVNDSRHLQADCQEPGTALEPYARAWSIRCLFLQRLYVSPVCHSSVTMKRVGFPTPPSPSLTVKRRWISQGGRDQRRDYQIMSHTNKLIAAQTDEARIMRRIMASTGTACRGLILN